MISPRAGRGAVEHNTYDHTSVLKMIEWRFGLAPLTVRDSAARNLAEVLDFAGEAKLSAPRYNVPRPVTTGCIFTDHTHHGEDWQDLAEVGDQRGITLLTASPAPR